MAGRKVTYIGSPTEYQDGGHGKEWDPKVMRPGTREVRESLDVPAGGAGLPPNAATGGVKVATGLRDGLYPQPDMGPLGARKPWIPPGRRKGADHGD